MLSPLSRRSCNSASSDAGLNLQRLAGDRLGKCAEVTAPGDEIGLAVHLDHGGCVAIGGTFDHDDALGGNAGGFLVGFRQALLAHELGGGIHIPLGLHQRLLTLHHPGAGALPEPLHCICCDVHD